MKKVHGNISGLKASQLKSLERIYRRKIPPTQVITAELARYLTTLSAELKKQIGILVDRKGNIDYVLLGDAKGIFIPELERFRVGQSRLRGLRCVHTHLRHEALTRDDLVDLALLRLDLMVALEVEENGLPGLVHAAHLLPDNAEGKNWELLPPVHLSQWHLDFHHLIQSLEEEFARVQGARTVGDRRDRAILVSVTTGGKFLAEDSMAELRELAVGNGVLVLDTIIQRRPSIDPRFVLGRGKLSEIVIRSLQLGADMLIFDQELTPAQVRSISNVTELKIIDRTQLILDIFAQRAHSREGKLQVELAQLKYLLPRLVKQDKAMSRLAGGIGGRGPGETKLEIDRRRVRDRIHQLERAIKDISRARQQRRARRLRKGMPIISIIGYTNAGKSTLLNTLTHSQVLAEDRPFATLDPTSRRLRFPQDREVIITDTVGFIRDLPRDLIAAFRATLEELQYADLLLQVVDISSPYYEEHILSVEKILQELHLEQTPRLLVFNKIDKVDPGTVENLCRLYGAIAISAVDASTLPPLVKRIEQLLWERFPAGPSDGQQRPENSVCTPGHKRPVAFASEAITDL
ncbi:MAG: GTPase HflX [Nitrospinota bacterium]|nr:MAG: GTPase HflX [Nitrospinota bacterium]